MSDTKICPFCGEEILSTAKKCKYCGEWLAHSRKPLNSNKNSSLGSGCAWIFAIFIFLISIIGNFLPDENYDSDNTSSQAEESYSDTSRISGRYSGFGYLAVASANNGGQMYNCLERGTGESLVEQVENFFENVSETYRPEFLPIINANSHLKFVISNPHWGESVTFMPEMCLASIAFPNVSQNTVIGNKDGISKTLADIDCQVSYTVSEQSGKFRANIFDVFCKPNEGYK